MTRAQHTRLGELLGFPPCCVAEWVDGLASGVGQATLRGGLGSRVRSQDECDEIIRRANEDPTLAPLGLDASFFRLDRRHHWVPCTLHALARDAGLLAPDGGYDPARREASLSSSQCDHARPAEGQLA